MITLVHSSLNGSSSFLQGTRITINTSMSLYDNHKSLIEIELQPDPISDCGVSCSRASGKILIDLQWEKLWTTQAPLSFI